ncbi:unnamed protein product [Caenorhabditis auriculariae]|uniref:C-type lectin domain-containing protein n=1 Tax=Caenorhabditis auriculariae TaxID=2777116 RepID=A0A8S1GWR5_9PELO|nr:unnamed protein product [Caenorhabditis auriculariae]
MLVGVIFVSLVLSSVEACGGKFSTTPPPVTTSLGSTKTTLPPPPCPKDWLPFKRTDGRFWCMTVNMTKMTAANAQSACEEQGANLNGFETDEEYTAMESYLLSKKFTGQVHLGGKRRAGCTASADVPYNKNPSSPCSRDNLFECRTESHRQTRSDPIGTRKVLPSRSLWKFVSQLLSTASREIKRSTTSHVPARCTSCAESTPRQLDDQLLIRIITKNNYARYLMNFSQFFKLVEQLSGSSKEIIKTIWT